jgi:ubiquitin C-terminal hydrolase
MSLCSEMKSYNPTSFCMAFKDLDGNPTNVSLQQDTNEFFNLFCDRLQTAIPAPNKLLPNQVFGGVLEYQSVCRGGHRSVREEPFFVLSVNVKHKRSILDSLEMYVDGERLEGDNAYSCTACGKKVSGVCVSLCSCTSCICSLLLVVWCVSGGHTQARVHQISAQLPHSAFEALRVQSRFDEEKQNQ